MDNYFEERPWGSFEHLLDEEYCKVKRIIVKPGERLSYQYHHERTEHWVVVQGEAIVTLDGEEYEYHIGDVVEIPVGTKHRVENKFNKEGNNKNVTSNETINPKVIIHPKSIIGLIPLNTKDKKAQIVVKTV